MQCPQGIPSFCNHLTGKLDNWGFKLNPCDACVANKEIYREQCTILWRADNLKISRADPKVVNSIIELLRQEHGKSKDAPLTARRGKTREHLGMEINFLTPGSVVLTMFHCIDEILNQMPAEF